MALLHLPVELLQIILNLVISETGIRKSLPLRLVCEHFNHYIEAAVFALPTFEDESDSSSHILSRDPAMHKAMVARLILHKLQTANADQRSLCKAIQLAGEDIASAMGQREEFDFRLLAFCSAQELHLDRIVSFLRPCNSFQTAEHERLDNALVAAILSQQLSLARMFLKRGARLTIQTKFFGSPLSVAVRVGNKDILLELVQLGMIEPSSSYDVAILTAVKESQFSIAELLLRYRNPFSPSDILRNGVKIDREVEFWTSLIHMAVEFNHEELIQDLLSKPGLSVQLKPALLADACRFGHVNIVKWLLAHHTPPSSESLFWAGYRGDHTIFNLLLPHLLDVNTIFDAVAAACLKKDQKIINYLSASRPVISQKFTDMVDSTFTPVKATRKGVDALENAFQEGCRSGNLKRVREILSTGYRSEAGFSIAALGRHPGILLYLFENMSPLFSCDTALASKSLAVFQVYLSHGWNINEPLFRTSPPLLGHITTDLRMVNWFLSHKANPNARCDWDITPMSLAICKASFSTIYLLFQNGATPRKGQLLHWAILRNDSDTLLIIELLLNFGAPINEIQYKNDRQSWAENYRFGMGTPLHTAVEYGQEETISLLLKKGADRDIRDSCGRTPLELAKSKGFLSVALLS